VQLRGEEVWVRICDGQVPPPAKPAAAQAPVPVVSSRTGVEIAPLAQPGAGTPATTAAGPISEDLVREELKKVIDPELFVNIVDLGLIYNVDLLPQPEGTVNCKIEMTMTSPMCPAGPQMIQNSKQVLGQLPGMGNVEVKIVLDPPWTPDKMTQEARDQLGIF
jgi:metal-sulfur cluster biosynthetic enzyme